MSREWVDHDAGITRLRERCDELDRVHAPDADWRDVEIDIFEAFAQVQEDVVRMQRSVVDHAHAGTPPPDVRVQVKAAQRWLERLVALRRRIEVVLVGPPATPKN